MKTCPRCGYEHNRPGALMCGLCGAVFAEAQSHTVYSRRPLGRWRKDFAAEIRANRFNSLALLIGLPLIIGMLGFAFDLYFGTLPWGIFGAIAFGAIAVVFAWNEGDRAILSFSGAREAGHDTDQQLFNVVDEMRIAAGLPMPRVYVIESDAANAFATGRDPRDASIAVTRGLLEVLSREELQGVVGHEMAHVKNLDIRYAMLVAALVGSVALLSDGLRRALWHGSWIGRRGRSEKASGPAGLLILVFALLLAILAPLFALMIQMAISRKRELLADASAVELTRNPLGLADALEKLERHAVSNHLITANRATQHLYIVNPLKHFNMNAGALFSTHPPTAARVRLLRAMAMMETADRTALSS